LLLGSIYSSEIDQNKVCGFICSLVYIKTRTDKANKAA